MDSNENSTQNPDSTATQTAAVQTVVVSQSKSNGLAITSMTLGIVGFLTGIWIIGVVLAIPGLILGIVSLSKRMGGKGMAITGVITSGAAIVFTIIFYAFIIDQLGSDFIMSDPTDEQIETRINEILR